MKKTNVLNLFIIVVVIIAAMMAIAAPAFAAGRCAFVEGRGWHIVGGGELNDHWYETQTECEIALQVPTVLATLQATNMPTDVPTDLPTDIPSEEPTNLPTDVPTDLPTDIPTASPTEPPVVTETPYWTQTPDHGPFNTPTPEPTAVSSKKSGMTCKKAWKLITETVYTRDVGFRFFDNPNHAQCKVWLWNKYGINYDVYRAMNY